MPAPGQRAVPVRAGVAAVSPEDLEQLRKDGQASNCWAVVLAGLFLISLREISSPFLPGWVGWALIPLALVGTIQMFRYIRRADRIHKKN